MNELDRRAAQAGIHRIAVPTPFQVGRVNAYLIDDEPLTLVDSGPHSERSLAELERLVERLEQGDLPLDQALSTFERGVTLTRECQSALQAAQQKVEILLKRSGQPQAQPFAVDEAPSGAPADD